MLGLNTAINNVNWNDILSNQNIEESFINFTDKYLQTARNHIPVRKIKIHSKEKPLVTPELRKLIRLLNHWSGTSNRTKEKITK